MSGLFSVNSPPTTETNGKNSSDTSTCNGGVHLCPFQLAPPINQYTYCVLKRICRRILREILSEECPEIKTVKDDLNAIQNKDVINENKNSPNVQLTSSSAQSSLTRTKNYHKPYLNCKNLDPKSNKLTQTKNEKSRDEINNTNMKKSSFNKQVERDFTKKNINLRPQLHKSGLPVILNLRLKVRNGEMLTNDN